MPRGRGQKTQLPGGVAAEVPSGKLFLFPEIRHGGGSPCAPAPALFFCGFCRVERLNGAEKVGFQSCAVAFEVRPCLFQIFPAQFDSLDNIGQCEAGDGGVRVALTFPRNRHFEFPDLSFKAVPHSVKCCQTPSQFLHLESLQLQQAASVQRRDSRNSGVFMA